MTNNGTWQLRHKNGNLYTVAATNSVGLQRYRNCGHQAVNTGSGWVNIQVAINNAKRSELVAAAVAAYL